MNKIIIYALSGKVEPSDALYECDGIEMDDYFGDYLDKAEFNFIDFSDSTGECNFYIEDGKLYVQVTYKLVKIPTDAEIEKLKEETQGQWSDGIGEGFEQTPCFYYKNEEVYISPWFPKQVVHSRII